jgi:hypothetical protein
VRGGGPRIRGGFEVLGVIGDVDMVSIRPFARLWMYRRQKIVLRVAELDYGVKSLGGIRSSFVTTAAGA